MTNLSFSTTNPMDRNGASNFSRKHENNFSDSFEKKPSQVVFITPELAYEWLNPIDPEKRKRNRPETKHSIEKYARIMRRGEWRANPSEPISFTKEGMLVNGHHRLRAVIEAGVPVSMAVVWDAEEDDFDIIDTGKKRTLGDIFALDNIVNSKAMASCVTRYIALCEGRSLRLTGDVGVASNFSADLAQDYLDEFYSCNYVSEDGEERNHYQEVYRFMYALYANGIKMLTATDMTGIAMFLYKKKGHPLQKAQEFFDALYNGGREYRYLQDLAVTLNNDYNSDKRMRGSRKQCLIAKAWNMFLRNSTARKVRVHMGEIVEFN